MQDVVFQQCNTDDEAYKLAKKILRAYGNPVEILAAILLGLNREITAWDLSHLTEEQFKKALAYREDFTDEIWSDMQHQGQIATIRYATQQIAMGSEVWK